MMIAPGTGNYSNILSNSYPGSKTNFTLSIISKYNAPVINDVTYNITSNVIYISGYNFYPDQTRIVVSHRISYHIISYHTIFTFII